MQAELKVAENSAKIKEYSSTQQITEKIDEQIAATKTTIGEYLHKLDNIRTAAANETDKKREQIYVNGIEIIVNTKPLNELKAIEMAARSNIERLTALKMARESLELLEIFSNIRDLKYLVLEKEGIPERILVKKLIY